MGMEELRILALAGSLRRASYNRKVLAVAVEAVARAGVQVETLDAKELGLPLYDGDLEAEHGIPPAAQALKDRIAAAHGLLIASPEYNGSIPGVLKNAIDWVTRGEPKVLRGKVAALVVATQGVGGGRMALTHLRHLLSLLGVWVIPDQLVVPNVQQLFGEDGRLQDRCHGQMERVAASLVDATRRLRS